MTSSLKYVELPMDESHQKLRVGEILQSAKADFSKLDGGTGARLVGHEINKW